MNELKNEQSTSEKSKEKKSPILKIILVVLILILILIIGFSIFIYINIKPFLMSSDGTTAGTSAGNYDHPLLNDQQEQILETVGIDVAKLPTSITPAMESCFVGALGQDRVNEIKGGTEPNAIDLFKAKSCLGQ